MTGDNHSGSTVTSDSTQTLSNELTHIAITLLDFVNVAGDGIRATLDKSTPAQRYVDHRKYLQKQLRLFTPPRGRLFTSIKHRDTNLLRYTMLHAHTNPGISTKDLMKIPGDMTRDIHSSCGWNHLEYVSDGTAARKNDLADNNHKFSAQNIDCVRLDIKKSDSGQIGRENTLKQTDDGGSKSNFISIANIYEDDKNILDDNKMEEHMQEGGVFNGKTSVKTFKCKTTTPTHGINLTSLFEKTNQTLQNIDSKNDEKTVPLRKRQLPASFWQEPTQNQPISRGKCGGSDIPLMSRDPLTLQYISQFYGIQYPHSPSRLNPSLLNRYHTEHPHFCTATCPLATETGSFRQMLSDLQHERRVLQVESYVRNQLPHRNNTLYHDLQRSPYGVTSIPKYTYQPNGYFTSKNGMSSAVHINMANTGFVRNTVDYTPPVGYPSPEMILGQRSLLWKPVATRTQSQRYHPYAPVR